MEKAKEEDCEEHFSTVKGGARQRGGSSSTGRIKSQQNADKKNVEFQIQTTSTLKHVVTLHVHDMQTVALQQKILS